MDWRDHIEVKADVMGGKPVFRGTRITVEIILDWLSAGWSQDEILANYPLLSADALRASYALARELIHEQLFTVIPRAA